MSLSVCSEDEEELIRSSARHTLTNGACQSSCTASNRGHLQRIISIEEDHLPHLLLNDCRPRTPLQECSEEEEASDDEGHTDLAMRDIYPCASSASQDDALDRETPSSPRGQPVGKETSLYVSHLSVTSRRTVRPCRSLAHTQRRRPFNSLLHSEIPSPWFCCHVSSGGSWSLSARPPLQDRPGGELQRRKDLPPSQILRRLLPPGLFRHCGCVWWFS